MKVLCLLNLFILIIALTPICGQSNPPTNTTNDTLIQSSVYPSLIKVSNENVIDYHSWKKGMKKRRKKEFLNGTIAGLIGGLVIGASINGLANGSCKAIETIVNPIIQSTESTCPNSVARGAAIGSGLGLLIGLGIGQENAKKVDIQYQIQEKLYFN